VTSVHICTRTRNEVAMRETLKEAEQEDRMKIRARELGWELERAALCVF
jgi:hypothetical protein